MNRPLTGEPDALCGQGAYVVLRLENLVFIGVFMFPTPHNILLKPF
jgi:hypothetical protein